MNKLKEYYLEKVIFDDLMKKTSKANALEVFLFGGKRPFANNLLPNATPVFILNTMLIQKRSQIGGIFTAKVVFQNL